MGVTCSRFGRLVALLGVMGTLAIGLARPAAAWDEVQFRQEIPVIDACLQSFDIFGSFWWVWGDMKLDTTWVMDDNGNCFVQASGLLNNRTLNYRSGFNHKMEAWFHKVFPCYQDPIDGTTRAKLQFPMLLRGPAGGWVDTEMRVMLTPTGVKVLGVTLEPAIKNEPL